MDITKRSEDIIRILLGFSEKHPASTAMIAEKLNLSTRSVQREMLYVEEWLESQGYHLRRKRGSGLWIDETEERKQAILDILNHNTESDQYLYDKVRRQRQIRIELLSADDPLKIYYLTEKCEVSEGTLLNDLNQLTPWFKKYNLNLIRRTGLGIFIQGEELDIRRALAVTICEVIEHSNSMGRYDRQNLHQYGQFYKDFDPDITEKANALMDRYEKNLDLQFTDSGYLFLVMYIALMVHRIQLGKTILIDENEQNELCILPEYGIAEGILNALRIDLNLAISRDEICGLAIQLSSTRCLPKNQKDLTRKRELNVHQIVVAIIREVSQDSMIDFTRDSSLANDLSIHLQPTIGRLRARIPIDNPLLENLKADYPDIYSSCDKVCTALFKELFSLDEVPQSEIGFITMHFAAAMERKEKNDRRIRVVIVCPTGIGSSRLLAADLKLEYPFLDIVRTQSAFDIDQRALLQEGIELIISTVKMDTKFRYVQVSNILTKHDKALINSRIEYLLRQKKEDHALIIPATNTIRKADIDYIALFGDTIYEVLDELQIHTAPIIHNRDEFIHYAATISADQPEDVEHFYQLLKERDQMADTYIKPFHALLLHGRSPLVKKPCFGYIRLEPPFYESGKVILGAVLSLIPSEGIKNKVSATITSEIIGSLLDNDQLLAAMRAGNIGLLHDLIEYNLLEFYKRHVAEVLKIPYEG